MKAMMRIPLPKVTIWPDLSPFGETLPGTTTTTTRQSVWTEGLTLEMIICYCTALPLTLINELQVNLAEHYWALGGCQRSQLHR